VRGARSLKIRRREHSNGSGKLRGGERLLNQVPRIKPALMHYGVARLSGHQVKLSQDLGPPTQRDWNAIRPRIRAYSEKDCFSRAPPRAPSVLPSALPASISSRRCSSAVIGSVQGKTPRLATSQRKASVIVEHAAEIGLVAPDEVQDRVPFLGRARPGPPHSPKCRTTARTQVPATTHDHGSHPRGPYQNSPDRTVAVPSCEGVS